MLDLLPEVVQSRILSVSFTAPGLTCGKGSKMKVLLAVIAFLTFSSALRGQTTFAFSSPSSTSGSQVVTTLNGLSAGQASPGQFVEFSTAPSLTVNQRMAYSPINSGFSVKKKDDKKVPSANPEPGTLVLFGTGMLALLRAGRRGLRHQQ